MLSEEGIVEEIKDGKAIVKVERGATCKHCSARGTCGVSFGSNKEIFIEVDNTLNAKVGDKVEISVPSGSLVKIALLVYILPIFSLIFGAYKGGQIAIKIGISSSVGSILGALLLLILSFYILKKIDQSFRKKEAYKIRMTKILSTNS